MVVRVIRCARCVALDDHPCSDSPCALQATPITVSGLPSAAVQIAAAATSSYALLSDGSVWAWGSGHDPNPARVDAYGADTTNRLHGSVCSNQVFVVLEDTTAMRDGVTQTELGSGIAQIDAGSGHSLVRKTVVPDCGSMAPVVYRPTSGADSTRQIACGANTEYGGTDCSFACDPGYYLSSGASPLICESDGSWSAAVCTAT